MRGLLLIVLVIAALGGALYAVMGIAGATNAVQEIEGLIGALILTVAVAAGYIVSAIDEHRIAAFPPPPKTHGVTLK